MTLPGRDQLPLLLHNPRCSKSRAAKALLEERGVAFAERRYLEDPLTHAELEDLARRLGQPPAAFVRRGEEAYRRAGLDRDSGDDELLRALASEPILLERPILVTGTGAVVGRPPERVLDLV